MRSGAVLKGSPLPLPGGLGELSKRKSTIPIPWLMPPTQVFARPFYPCTPVPSAGGIETNSSRFSSALSGDIQGQRL